MNKQTPLITAKLVVPKVKSEVVRRMKLSKKMQTIPAFPLTIIHSPAGHGKSTALALFVSDEKPTWCWYTISATDADILSFLSYMTASIRIAFPSFGTKLLQLIRKNNRYIREEELRQLCSSFINEVISMKQEFYLILDDFHLLEGSYTVNRWMELLLDFMPQNLHLIISGRTIPKWSRLAVMKVQERLLEIKRADLLFSEEEAEMILEDYFQQTLHPDVFQDIYQLTGGWVIALRMAALHFMETIGTGKGLELSSEFWLDIFQYFEFEVFSKQPPIIQQFLELTSILDVLEGELCDLILGINASETILCQLAEKNLFIEKKANNTYHFHPLFKIFLEDRLKQNNKQRFYELHEKCARFFEEKEKWENAVFHYEKINQLNAVASLLNEFGPSMLENGKLDVLNEKLKTIPNHLKDIYYQLWFMQGEICRYRSHYKEAEKCYEWTISAAENNQDDYGMSKGLEGKAKIYLDTIQPYKAKRLLYKVIEIRESCNKSSDKEMGELYHLLSENLINSGQALQAEKWLRRAESLHAPVLDRNLEARLCLRTGRFEKAKEILLDSFIHKGGESLPLPQSHRETYLLLSLIEAFLGKGTDAKSYAQEGIQLGVRIESPFVEACGWIRMGHAAQILNRYDPALVVQCYETALAIMDEIKVARGRAEPLMGLCMYYGSAGEYEKALDMGRSALRETEKVHDMWLAAWITLCMGISSLYAQHYVQAKGFLAKSRGLFETCGDDYGMTLLLLWDSYYYYEKNEPELFRQSLERLTKKVQNGGYDFLFHRRTLFGPKDLQMFAPLLLEANKQKISPQYIPKLLQEMNIYRLDSHPGYTLRIQTLGGFRVFLGDREIEGRDWQRGKAKELLQLFVTRYGEYLTKDDLYELLWTNQNEKSAANDLKVALNALNNVLEPGRKARTNPFFIEREGSSYCLSQKIPLELDALIFEEWLKAGLEEKNRDKSIQYLRTGLKLYKGDYLPERKYDDWCLNIREKLLVLFLRGAEKLAQLSVSEEDYSEAIHWCGRILEKDHTWEEAYRLLMFCYYKKNNRTFAIKWYKKCCEVLQQEMGVPPLESTLQIYQMIIQSS